MQGHHDDCQTWHMRMWTQDNTELQQEKSAHNMSEYRGVDAVHESCPQRPTIEM